MIPVFSETSGVTLSPFAVARAQAVEPTQQLANRVLESYANTSRLYRWLERDASLMEITRFMHWDAAQPPFSQYLNRWVDRVPLSLHADLLAHLAEEVDGEHSRLFLLLLDHLNTNAGVTEFDVDHGRLENLNYTFSQACAERESPFFFVGSFYATEVMSAKRCEQIYNGLIRLGFDPAAAELEYLHLHAVADVHHGAEIMERMIEPLLVESPEALRDLVAGVEDRLERSGQYLHWYEATVAGLG